MSENEEVHVNDIGASMELEIVEDGVAIDISSATNVKMRFQKPSGTRLEKSAAFVNDGTDGLIRYITQDGDLDEPGIWLWQASMTIGAWSGHSERIRFRVWPNIAAPA